MLVIVHVLASAYYPDSPSAQNCSAPISSNPSSVTVGALKAEEPERPVLLDRSARGDARLHRRLSRLIDVAERIRRLDVAVAQVTKCAAVEVVAPRLRDNVDHTSGGLPIFGLIAVRDDLKLLHRVLRNRRPHSVVRVVHRIRVINVDQVAAGALPADVDPEVREPRQCSARRLAQVVNWSAPKLVSVPAIEGLDHVLVDRGARRRLLCLDQPSLSGVGPRPSRWPQLESVTGDPGARFSGATSVPPTCQTPEPPPSPCKLPPEATTGCIALSLVAFLVVLRERPRASVSGWPVTHTTAPLASFTVTCSSAVCTCASAPAARHTIATT